MWAGVGLGPGRNLGGACEWTPPKSYRTQGPGPAAPQMGAAASQFQLIWLSG